MLKHELRQVDSAVLAGQSSYFSMLWIHAVAVPSLIRACAPAKVRTPEQETNRGFNGKESLNAVISYE